MRKRSSTSVVIKSCDRDSIERAVRSYVQDLRKAHPEIKRAIWFGSWVNGIPTPGSDLDLCLILSSSNKTMRDRVPDYLPVGFPVGIDLFPYTEEEFGRLKARSPSWLATILSGKEL
jgi:predicted nucleotidyltransferase